ncbi:MAG TPA: thermonuclease family protein [Patescibacteria group bacterium]|nr:thermonuclease family protein [Patescibacteria group bacterium]
MSHRIVISFFVLASVFAFTARAQDTSISPEQLQQIAPQNLGMHTLEGAAPTQPLTQQIKNAPPDQSSAFDNLKPNYIRPPDQLPSTDIRVQHMGQSILDQQIIHEPGLDPPAATSTTFGVISASPPPAPAAPQLRAPSLSSAAKNTDFADLRRGDTSVVGQVVDPLRVRMTDGRMIQLTGVDIPDLDPYEPGPAAIAARDLLKELLEGKQVRLYVTKNPASGRISRMGDMLAHLETLEDGYWVQGVLIAAGLARVRPSDRNIEMAVPMMKLEDQARAEKKGLWADPRYGILTPDTAKKAENNWGIVDGTVYSANLNRNTVYLDFDVDWHTDFTVAIDGNVRRALEAAGIDALGLGGKHIRVRGWIRDYNGPFMDLENAVWLEVLTDAPVGQQVKVSDGRSAAPVDQTAPAVAPEAGDSTPGRGPVPIHIAPRQ